MSRIALISMLALAACVPQADAPDDRPATLTDTKKAECAAAGGKVAIAGISGGEFCAERMPDAGQACTRLGDCTGYCDAETRTCSTYNNTYGCWSYMDENGQPQMICAD